MVQDIKTREIIENAIVMMLEENEKITISSVAAKAGVSHSLIYNRYPDLLFKIKQLKDQQKSKSIEITSREEVIKLKDNLIRLKKELKENKEIADSYKKQNNELWEHIQQIYEMYDQVIIERNSFAEKLGDLE